jgi:hypothetical protein
VTALDTITRAKLALALVAAILFAASMRMENADYLRWVAIALLTAAVALRFFRPKPPPQ